MTVSSIKFEVNRSIGSRVDTCRRTYRRKGTFCYNFRRRVRCMV